MKLQRLTTKALSLCMAAFMLLGSAAPTVRAAGWIHHDHEHEHKDTIRYVSVGDSMTNGYGFCGYLQDEHDAYFNETGETEYDFFAGKGVYGEGSYALQFEAWLEEKTGSEVEHTKLALSAQRAEEVLYLLGVTEEPPVDGYFSKSWAYAWNGGDFVEGTSSGLEDYYAYKYNTDDPAGMAMIEAQEKQMKAYYQESLRNADVISLGFGNAAFNAFFFDRALRALGALGSVWVDDKTNPGYAPKVTLEDALAMADSESVRQIILDAYDLAKTELLPGDSADWGGYDLEGLCDLIAYITAGFVTSYKGVLDWIAENNPDAEIILVGLLNSNAGMTISGVGDEPFDFGGLMDKLYGLLNVYVAALPILYQAAGEYEDLRFYYTEQPEDPQMVAALIADLARAGWNNVDCGVENCPACKSESGCESGRLEGKTVRFKTVTVYNDIFLPLLAFGFGVDLRNATTDLKTFLASTFGDSTVILENVGKISTAMQNGSTITDMAEELAGDTDPETVQAYVPKVMAAIALLALENAIVESLNSADLNLGGIASMAGSGLMYAFAGVNFDYSAEGATVASGVDYFTDFFTTPEMLPFIRLVALVMVGNGISSHSSPTTHDRVAEKMIEAYETGRSLKDEVRKSLDGSYTVTDSSYYVALTGEASGYADLLAEALHLDTDTQFSKMTWDGLDYHALIQADLITVGYDEAQISGFAVDQALAFIREYLDQDLRSTVKAYLNRALLNIFDEELVGEFTYTVDGLLTDALNQKPLADKEKQPMDWADLLDEEGARGMEKLLASIRDGLIASDIPEVYAYTIDVVPYISEVVGFKESKLYEWLGEDAYFTVEIPVADTMMYALESYLYSLISFEKIYAETIVTILLKNPDASVVLLGRYNPFAGVEMTLGETVVSLDEVYGMVVAGMSVVPRLYAYMGLNVSYVDIPATETVYTESEVAYTWMDVLTTPTLSYPGEAGYAYILEQILASVDVTCEHKYENCADADCDRCGEEREAPGHHWTDATCTEAKICSVCGVTEGAALGHTWTEATCTASKTCAACGETEGEALGHDFGEATCTEPAMCSRCDVTDGEALGHTYDNACDADCGVCDETRTPADHDFGEWETTKEPAVDQPGEKHRVCSVCGHEETETVPALEPETTVPDTEPATEPVTEPTTEPVTEPVTEPATESEPTDVPETDAETKSEKQNNCQSAFVSGVVLWILMGAAVLVTKKKEN